MQNEKRDIISSEQQKEILSLLGKDPQKAMNIIVEQYTGLLWKIASKHLANPEDIKECVNDAFMDFYCHWDRFDENKGTLMSYLAAIVRNQAVSRYRRNKPKETFELQEDTAQAADEISKTEIRMDIEHALAELKPEDAEIIRMKYYGGMTVQEIADSLGLPYETVKKRHQRSVAKLRLLLALLTMLLAGLLGACAYIVLRHFGIVPGYGVNTNSDRPVYTLYEKVSAETEFGICTVEDALVMEGELWLWVDLAYQDLDQRERMMEAAAAAEWYLQTEGGDKEQLFRNSYGRSSFEADKMQMRFYAQVNENDSPGEEIRGTLYGLGTEFPFVLKKAEEQRTENYSHVFGEKGGLLAIPQLDQGELKVAVYPLNTGDYRILPTLIRGLHMEGKTGDITVSAPDGRVITGEMNYGESSMDQYTQWDFGPASPGQYVLHVPYAYLAAPLEEPVSISLDLENCSWEEKEYNVPGGKLSVADCRLLELEEGTMALDGCVMVKEGASYWGLKLRYQPDEGSDMELSGIYFTRQCKRLMELEELSQEEIMLSSIKFMEAEIEPEPGCMEYVIEIGRAEYYDLREFQLSVSEEYSMRWNHEFEIPLTVEE